MHKESAYGGLRSALVVFTISLLILFMVGAISTGWGNTGYVAHAAERQTRVPPHATWRASYYGYGSIGTCGPITPHGLAANSRQGFRLPCGTKLLVCHHSRCAVLIVQDRMGAYPKSGCRCVDLRPWGFHRVCGSLAQGVCRVRVEKR